MRPRVDAESPCFSELRSTPLRGPVCRKDFPDQNGACELNGKERSEQSGPQSAAGSLSSGCACIASEERVYVCSRRFECATSLPTFHRDVPTETSYSPSRLSSRSRCFTAEERVVISCQVGRAADLLSPDRGSAVQDSRCNGAICFPVELADWRLWPENKPTRRTTATGSSAKDGSAPKRTFRGGAAAKYPGNGSGSTTLCPARDDSDPAIAKHENPGR